MILSLIFDQPHLNKSLREIKFPPIPIIYSGFIIEDFMVLRREMRIEEQPTLSEG